MATTSLLMVLRHLKNVVQIITLAPFRVPSWLKILFTSSVAMPKETALPEAISEH